MTSKSSTRKRKNLIGLSFRKKMQSVLIGSVFILFATVLSLLPGKAEGLQCYECLSLTCPSGAICESIRKTMIKIFVPKSHVIHFDPNDPCPENEDPNNSSKWANLTRECQRSDSVCLVSPIEIMTILDGSKGGRKLEAHHELTTHGFLRGCASRRKLLENEPTIKVQVNLLPIKNSSESANYNSKNDNPNPNGEVYNMINSADMELDLFKLKFEDDYSINKVYSHTFYIDQYTDNATRCYQDNCNTKVRVKSSAISNLLCSSWRDNNLLLLVGLLSVVSFNLVNSFSVTTGGDRLTSRFTKTLIT